MKKVLIVSTSLRKNSNSERLAKELGQGASEAGHSVEHISLVGKRIAFCNGCMACQHSGRCAINDDAVSIAAQIKDADVLVFATPIYYYEMCGQMKTLLDRCNSIFGSDYAFRDIYLLTAAADGDDAAMDGAIKGMQGWVDCFERARLAGVLRGVGLTDAGEAAQAAKLLAQAHAMGKQL